MVLVIYPLYIHIFYLYTHDDYSGRPSTRGISEKTVHVQPVVLGDGHHGHPIRPENLGECDHFLNSKSSLCGCDYV